MYINKVVICRWDNKKSTYNNVKSILFTYDKLVIWEGDSADVLDIKDCAFFIKAKGVVERVVSPSNIKETSSLKDSSLGEIKLHDMLIEGVLPELAFEGCEIPISLSLEDSEDAPSNCTSSGLSDSDLFVTYMVHATKKFNFLYGNPKEIHLEEASTHINDILECITRANATFSSCNFAPMLNSISDNLNSILGKAKSNPSKKLTSAWFNNLRVRYLMNKIQKDEKYSKLIESVKVG